MLTSTLINYLCGLGIYYLSKKKQYQRLVLSIGIFLNLSILVYYKYLDFILENLQIIGFFKGTLPFYIALPIGISFFTFQGMSYIIDVYRDDARVQTNPIHLGLYIALFPQLIAGPIVRYQDIADQIEHRIISRLGFSDGIRKFIRGLSKKVIFANTAAVIADNTFALEPTSIPIGVAWLGIICYTLQIYFDFSGYSDMAIGLGKMFGFHFKENFNHPYIAKSIREFWRRWHISLSTWFRDYLYISLGGNRKGELITYRNLFIVFFITGFWHGASWNFIIWGLFHGAFLILERAKIIDTSKLPNMVGHAYALLVVILGWVLFRAESLEGGVLYLGSMFGLYEGTEYYPLLFLTNYNIFIILTAIILSTPIRVKFYGILARLQTPFRMKSDIVTALENSLYIVLLIYTLSELAQSNYNPFIYFRF